MDGRICSWAEGARQVLGQIPDAVGRGVAGAHVVPAGRWCCTAEESPCRAAVLKVCTQGQLETILDTDACNKVPAKTVLVTKTAAVGLQHTHIAPSKVWYSFACGTA